MPAGRRRCIITASQRRTDDSPVADATGPTDDVLLDRPLHRAVLAALDDLKAVDPVAIDVRQRTGVTDVMVVASGNSNRHVKAIANAVVERAAEVGVKPIGVEGEQAAEWILVDLGDAVVHVMLPALRDLYRLERIWAVQSGEDSTEA